MVKAQEWLDKNYPKETRSKVAELDLGGKYLEGSLYLHDFPNLEELYCANNTMLKYLDVSTCSKLRVLNCSTSDLKLSNCPKLTHLYFRNSGSTELDLRNNSELQVLDCSNYDLTSGIINLRFADNIRLKKLDCSHNLLSNTLFLQKLHPESLTELNMENNNFAPQNLDFLRPFVNLQRLSLGSYDLKIIDDNAIKTDYIEKGIYNRFYGSLEPLRNMNKLERLDIGATDIDSGLEYLPSNLQEIKCNNWTRKDAKVGKIADLISDKKNRGKSLQQIIYNCREIKKTENKACSLNEFQAKDSLINQLQRELMSEKQAREKAEKELEQIKENNKILHRQLDLQQELFNKDTQNRKLSEQLANLQIQDEQEKQAQIQQNYPFKQ